MKVKVKFFATFKELFGAESREIEMVDGANIKDLLAFLCRSNKLRKEIFDDSGEVRPYVIILKNGRHIKFFDGIRTRFQGGDTVALFPPVGGG